MPPRVPDIPGFDVRTLTPIRHRSRALAFSTWTHGEGVASIEQARDRLLPCDAFAVQQFLGVASHSHGETTIARQPVESGSDRLRLRIQNEPGFFIVHDLQEAACISHGDDSLGRSKSLHSDISYRVLIDGQIGASERSVGERSDLVARAIAEPKLDLAAKVLSSRRAFQAPRQRLGRPADPRRQA